MPTFAPSTWPMGREYGLPSLCLAVPTTAKSALTRRLGTSHTVSPSAGSRYRRYWIAVQTLHSWFVPAGGRALRASEPAGGAGTGPGGPSRFPEKDIWCYSGYLFESLRDSQVGEYSQELLKELDVLVDGPFVLEKKDLSLRFRDRPTSRLIDVPASLRAGAAVLWDGAE